MCILIACVGFSPITQCAAHHRVSGARCVLKVPPVTSPLLLMVATLVLLELQVTALLVALLGAIVAVSCLVPPIDCSILTEAQKKKKHKE